MTASNERLRLVNPERLHVRPRATDEPPARAQVS